ncbi:hypothetical protein [Gordonia hankookensis]|uniref:Serine/threonine protein kinase n=1 Tax=Gordonia hankookensis TaxID=589403 RepID=A0ABR7W8L4_9ACTN|nr:hypothetical protein [Gordonia hankookensis]MBD1319148.1 hypothetical protein [Gordonia hankookensis]NDZ93509.1 hypothetical protein [Streptomyces sp. SID11726]NEB27293.1 hypothetical protein [Streptomyces sp. SID6673]
MIEPQGPLPPEIYWRRRIVAFGGAAVVLALIIGLIIWATGSNGDNPSNTAAASSVASSTAYSTAPTAESSDPSASGQVSGGGTGGGTDNSSSNGAPGGDAAAGASGSAAVSSSVPAPSGVAQAPGPVPPSGLCPDANISVVLYTDKPTYSTGDQPVFTIVTTNAGLTDCTRDVGKAAQNVVVRTLDGTRTLWSARDCSPLQTVNNVNLKPSQQVRDTITWSGTTSSPGCDKPRVPIAVGAYQAIGKIGEKESAPITFNVVAPAQP